MVDVGESTASFGLSVLENRQRSRVLLCEIALVVARWWMANANGQLGGLTMGVADKFSNKAEDLGGRAKEATGAATGDDDLKAEGKADQASSAIKDGVEKVKDKANEVADKLTGK